MFDPVYIGIHAMLYKKADEVFFKEVDAGSDTELQVLIGPEEAPNFCMRRFRMKPGGGMPEHTNTVEHQQYVLGGRARIGIGSEVIEVSRDDVIFIPAGVAHWYESLGPGNFEFICMVPNGPDKIEILGNC